jgi:hypothetical protein
VGWSGVALGVCGVGPFVLTRASLSAPGLFSETVFLEQALNTSANRNSKTNERLSISEFSRILALQDLHPMSQNFSIYRVHLPGKP